MPSFLASFQHPDRIERERWIQTISEKAGVPFDSTHVAEEYIVIESPDDKESRNAIEEAILKLENQFKGRTEFVLNMEEWKIEKDAIPIAELDEIHKDQEIYRYLRELVRKSGAKLSWRRTIVGSAEIWYSGDRVGKERVIQLIRTLEETSERRMLVEIKPEKASHRGKKT